MITPILVIATYKQQDQGKEQLDLGQTLRNYLKTTRSKNQLGIPDGSVCSRRKVQ